MKAALFYGGKDIRVEEVARPWPGPGEVLIEVRAAGVCGSDLHRYRGHDPWGSAPQGQGQEPRRAGHELAGVVCELGPGVDDLTVGQAVAVEPMQLAGCDRCPPCRRGDYNVCPRRGMFGDRRWTSAGFSELDLARRGHVFPLPSQLPCAVAALADVYACAVHAIHRAPIEATDTVLVLGTGPIGLALGQVARLAGARRTLLVGRRRAPLDTALRIGAADEVISLAEVDRLGEAVRDLGIEAGVDLVFEAVGGSGNGLLLQGLDALAFGGTLCILGAFEGDVALPYRDANDKEITVRWSTGYASWQGRREIEIALDWMADGRLQAAPLVTHRFPLSKIGEAFRAADDKQTSGAIKVMVEPQA